MRRDSGNEQSHNLHNTADHRRGRCRHLVAKMSATRQISPYMGPWSLSVLYSGIQTSYLTSAAGRQRAAPCRQTGGPGFVPSMHRSLPDYWPVRASHRPLGQCRLSSGVLGFNNNVARVIEWASGCEKLALKECSCGLVPRVAVILRHT
jgi:hypothetical protein